MKKKVIHIAASLAGTAVIAGITFIVWFELTNANKIYPGIKIGGFEVAGLTQQEALSAMTNEYSSMQILVLSWGPSKWVIPESRLGLEYDLPGSIAVAYKVGREGNIFNDWTRKMTARNKEVSVDPQFFVNDEILNRSIASISAQINIPAQEPEIKLDYNKQLTITTGENGQQVDEKLLKQRILLAYKNVQNKQIEIPVIQLKPKLSDNQLETTRLRATNLINKKLLLYNPVDQRSWEVNDLILFSWMEPLGGWKKGEIERWINELASTIDRNPENANFHFENGKVVQFKPGKDGLKTKQYELEVQIMNRLEDMEANKEVKTIDIDMETTSPSIKTADVNDLGIKELLARGESWFSGSINNRIFNLQKSAQAINGVLVAPGETFSFNKQVGEISTATGYKQAYVIKDGKTILGDGGGVCQTSSTLFRAVLKAGLPIEERVAHAYRVSYYEEKYEPGFDATIFQPDPDFKFVNDTPRHILIQMVFDERQKYLAFEIYGTNDGRKVDISKARVWEVTAPPPDLYQDDPTQPIGKITQVEHKAWGAKVAFDWKVTRGEEILQQRTFYSYYRPWQAVYLRGTKI